MLHLGVALWFCLLLPAQAAQTAHTKPPGAHKAQQTSLNVHVLNVLNGLPVKGLATQFFQLGGSGVQWKDLLLSTTNRDGRLGHPLQLKAAATYKVHFKTGAYWQKQGRASLYPYVEVVFNVTKADRKMHMGLLLSPYSYTSFRGS